MTEKHFQKMGERTDVITEPSALESESEWGEWPGNPGFLCWPIYLGLKNLKKLSWGPLTRNCGKSLNLPVEWGKVFQNQVLLVVTCFLSTETSGQVYGRFYPKFNYSPVEDSPQNWALKLSTGMPLDFSSSRSLNHHESRLLNRYFYFM